MVEHIVELVEAKAAEIQSRIDAEKASQPGALQAAE